MKFFLMISGLILMSLTFKEILVFLRQSNELNERVKAEKDDNIEKRLNIIEAKIDLLAENTESLFHSIKLNRAASDKTPAGLSFSRSFQSQMAKSEYERMYEEYQKGASVTEIARKFNRGKGEVQLILNLKK